MSWLKTNIRDRLNDHSLDFKAQFDFSNASHIPFHYISKSTAFNIASKHKNIFIGLSGGMDSEYVCKTFIEIGQSFTPVIVDTPANQLEVSYAYHFCRKHDIEPVIIKKTEKELFELFFENVFNKLNGYGKNSIAALLVGNYAKENNGCFVRGEQCIENGYYGVNEWDFYNEVLIENDPTILFFLHNPEIAYSMIKEYDFGSEQEFKHRLYEIPFRPKLSWLYSPYIERMFDVIFKNRTIKPKAKYVLQL